MKKKYGVYLLIAAVLAAAAFTVLNHRAQENTFTDVPLTAAGITAENVEITIPGMDGGSVFRFIWLADLHIIRSADSVNTEDVKTVETRMESFVMQNGSGSLSSSEQWEILPEVLNSCHPDALLLGGDMIDFCSPENAEFLRSGLERLTMPYMYVLSDHDTQPFWCDEKVSSDTLVSLRSELGFDTGVFRMDFPDFIIAGWNNNDQPMNEASLEEFKGIFSDGRPVILLMHVPLDSSADSSLGELSSEVWGGRNLSWGKNTWYYPDETTQEFLDLVSAENSPVTDILCGHLHFQWNGSLNGTIGNTSPLLPTPATLRS